ncbi:LmeA family phospholipid-binding protein [Cellulomonas biazotea]|uniref:LmeA family phospholipid-binding protein n=1 Tax=Cellulomonas biazotea TaxID=1709 RepID=UPI001FE40018|nr:DUF2993 domain-containing protein [Cellulomonas biazotea]
MSGRAVAVTVSVVLVLGAGVVVADRVAASMAERRAVEAVQENLDVTGTPSLSIEGFPFLTQVLAGSLDDVSGSVDGVTLDGGITATDVTFDAQGVQTSEPYTVSTGTISATLPTATLEQVVAEQTDLDVDVSVEGDRLIASGAVLGVDLSAASRPSRAPFALPTRSSMPMAPPRGRGRAGRSARHPPSLREASCRRPPSSPSDGRAVRGGRVDPARPSLGTR